jgi:hypothetical protein
MAHFSTARIEEVVPKRKQRQPSQRAQTQQLYQNALRSAFLDGGQALVVELEPQDKPLTIRNRIKRAADALGIEHVTIRRRRDRIYAYRQLDESNSGE